MLQIGKVSVKMDELDLSYITPRIIAMGAPFDTPPLGSGIGKNEASRVAEFLARRHGHHFRVFDLTLERAYSMNTFTAAVSRFAVDEASQKDDPIVVRRGFADHHALPLNSLFTLLDEIDKYLALDKHNVAALHCMAGRGRTGLVICSYLLYIGLASSAEEAFAIFSHSRGQPLRTPSQRRYVNYVQKYLYDIMHVPSGVSVSSALDQSVLPLRVPEPPVVVKCVELKMAPPGIAISLEFVQLLPPHKRLIARSFDVFDGCARIEHVMSGDFMIRALQVVPHEEPLPILFRVSMNSLFIQSPGTYLFQRGDIDGGLTGGFYNDRFGSDFSIVLSTVETNSFFRAKL